MRYVFLVILIMMTILLQDIMTGGTVAVVIVIETTGMTEMPGIEENYQHLLPGGTRMTGKKSRERRNESRENEKWRRRERNKENRPAGMLDQANSQFHFTCDDEFFYLSSHVDKTVKEKIMKGEVDIDLSKLIMKRKPASDNKLGIINKEGRSFLFLQQNVKFLTPTVSVNRSRHLVFPEFTLSLSLVGQMSFCNTLRPNPQQLRMYHGKASMSMIKLSDNF